MALRDLTIEVDYNKEYTNVVESFYKPCMLNSNLYERITGYFGSSIFYICWDSLREFLSKNGKIRIVCSPCLSDSDQKAIISGYEMKAKSIIEDSIIGEVKDLLERETISSSYKALACLIANGFVEFKIAVPLNDTPDEIKKLFHDKTGLFSDSFDSVGFSGGINETFNGWSQEGNMDSIFAFTSWEGDKDRIRVNHIREYFDQLWFKTVKNTLVYDFPSEAEKIIKEKAKNYNFDELMREIDENKSKAYKWKPNKNSSKNLKEHQLDALENWVKAGRKGIFEHATGSGKTFTAICAIRDSLLKKEIPLILVPSKELLYQWRDEIVNNISGIGEFSILLCGDGNIKWKTERLLNKITKNIFRKKYIIIAIMATACDMNFISELNQGNHLFIVADEVHRMGSPDRRLFFSVMCGPRLGLSATPRRFGDAVGTKAIFDYFGDVIKPVFTLKDAIDKGVLTKYFYFPKTTNLSFDEQNEYDALTSEINKIYAINSGDNEFLDNNAHYKNLLLKRSKILKNASSKTTLAISVISENYKSGQKWIVYCDNSVQLKKVLSLLVNNGFDAYEYYSSMEGDRKETLNYFNQFGGIMVSIKCLDEGVDIPSTTHALILASSKNPREFIQRRGRILRNHVGKNLAFLYDAVILPQKSDTSYDSLLLNEFARAIQFGSWAENNTCIAELKNIAIDYNLDIEKLVDGGFDDNGEQE